MTPVPVPCSRNAHDQSVLVRRPQWDQHGCHSKRGKASELGRPISIDDGRSMCAVKNNLPTPSGEVGESEGPRWTRAVFHSLSQDDQERVRKRRGRDFSKYLHKIFPRLRFGRGTFLDVIRVRQNPPKIAFLHKAPPWPISQGQDSVMQTNIQMICFRSRPQ